MILLGLVFGLFFAAIVFVPMLTGGPGGVGDAARAATHRTEHRPPPPQDFSVEGEGGSKL